MKAAPAFDFAGSVFFAALAALAYTPVTTACDGDSTTLAALYLTLVTAAYALLLGRRGAGPLGAVGVVVGAGALGCFASSLAPTALALTFALAYARGFLLFPGRFERPLRVEIGLGCAAFAAVTLTVSRSQAGISLAVWAFFLVQSAFFLVTPRAERTADCEDSASIAPEAGRTMGGVE